MLSRRAAALFARGAASTARSHNAAAAPRRWPVAAAAAAAAAAALACTPSPPAFALHGAPSGDPDAAFASLEDGAPPSAQQLAALHAWLAAHGADVAGVAVAPCTSDPAAGLGVVSTRAAPASAWLPRPLRPAFWLRSPGRTLAEFPLQKALSARSVCAEPRCGALYRRWVADGSMSDREAVMLFLFVERARGAASAWAPYIACLPSRPPGPVCWRASELAELRGTPAAEAVAAQRRALAAALPRLAPLATQALAAAGVRGELTLSDLAWASGVFWSRALAMPDLEALRQRKAGEAMPALQEAIVPGLDFCNHAPNAPATWTLLGPRAALSAVRAGGDAMPTTVALQERGCGAAPLRAGAEVRISYGSERSSEELLFGYGFAPEDDTADALVLMPPLPPPSDVDPASAARLTLLHVAGRAPRAFLPLRPLRARGDRQARAAIEDALHMLLPFSMSELELAAALEALPADGDARPGGADADAEPPLRSGTARRGALLLAVALLEQRVAALSATGTAAADDVALSASPPPPPRRRAALLYRRTQKRCADGYLALARAMLREEMARPL